MDKVGRASIDGMEMPWEEVYYWQEAVWRKFYNAHGEVGRQECKLSVLVQEALEGTIGGEVRDVSIIGVYR